MVFSSVVKIDQLNDYLNLSEECVLPVRKDGDAYEVKSNNGKNKLKAAAPQKGNSRIVVGLSDCMSCSGCLTSAEEIILKDRGYTDIADKIKASQFTAVSIAPQTAFMFATSYNVSHQSAFKKLAFFFKSMGVKRVYDLSIGEAVALNESKVEFENAILRALDPETRDKLEKGQSLNADDFAAMSKADIPIITGHCPGWTVYAEKTLNEDVVAKISKVSSSQQIQGALIKTLTYLESVAQHVEQKVQTRSLFIPGRYTPIKETLKLLGSIKGYDTATPMPVYHVSTAPCYDKKIEAFNSDWDVTLSKLYGVKPDNELKESIKLVDDVLSTGDIQRLIEQRGIDFRKLPEVELDRVITDRMAFLYSTIFGENIAIPYVEHSQHFRPGEKHSQSGGFVEEIMKFAARRFLGMHTEPVFEETINSDYREASLRLDGKVVMKFVMAYGFRNIQNTVMQLKKGGIGCPIAYIELMACPGGCFNGAGQILEPPEQSTNAKTGKCGFTAVDMKKLTEKAARLYHEETKQISKDDNEDLGALLSVVLPTFNRLLGRSLTAITYTRKGVTNTGTASLKW